VSEDFSHEKFATDNPDGSMSLDAYAGWSREELKRHCRRLSRSLDGWQFSAMFAATDGANSLENVSEPHRSKIANLIEAYSDDDEPADTGSVT
jgi:hypothetical protein